MAVKIRLKKLGRKHRPYYRVCVMDARSPRGGKVLEEVGTYDPMIRDTDARAVLNGERVSYWIGVGAQPTEKVAVLIKKYGATGTHLDAQKAALDKMAQPSRYAGGAAPAVIKKEAPVVEPPAPEAPAAEAPAEEAPAAEAPAEETAAEAPAEEAAAEAPAEEEKASE